MRSGLLDSLGVRRDVEAVPLLTAALADAEPQVIAAAATALGHVGTPEAAAALGAVPRTAAGADRLPVDKGLLIAADRLLRAGNVAQAAAIYQNLSQPDEPRAVRSGGAARPARAAGPQAAALVHTWLTGDDALPRSAAASALPSLATADLHGLAAAMAAYPTSSQVEILSALRLRGDRSLAPLAAEAAGSTNEEVRIAAVRALGVLGDAATLPLLFPLAKAGDRVGEAARQSIESLADPQTDARILAAMQAEQDAARRAAWIAMLEAGRPPRRCPPCCKRPCTPTKRCAARPSRPSPRWPSPATCRNCWPSC